jgi:hypothetical protein
MSLSKNLTHVLNTKKCFLEVKTEPFHQDCVRTEERAGFKAKSEQSARSMSTGMEMPGKTTPHLASSIHIL